MTDRTDPRRNAVVWAEIPVTDLDAASAFYGSVLGTTLPRVEMGGVATAVIPYVRGEGVSANLQIGTPPARPGTGVRVHLAVDGPLDAVAGRVRAAGGTVTGGVTALPVGRYVEACDRDGNPIGLFEAGPA